MNSIHPTAIISPRAELGDDITIGPYTVIEEAVRVGDQVWIGPHVNIRSGTTLGAGCQVHTGAILGDLPQDLAFRDCVSYLRIGKNNTIREYATIHRGTTSESQTLLGDENYLMGFSHVAHNCQIGNKVVLANSVLLAGYVQVADFAFLSGYVVVHQFVRIGRLVMASAMARITKDVPPFLIAGATSEVWGVNIVGLRRAGLPSQVRSRIREAYKILYRSGFNTTQAIERLKQNLQVPEVGEFIRFVESSKRGICRSRNLLKSIELEDIETTVDS